MAKPQVKQEHLPPSDPLVPTTLRIHRSTLALFDAMARARSKTAAELMRATLEAAAERVRASRVL